MDNIEETYPIQKGLTKREYFAIQCLAPLINRGDVLSSQRRKSLVRLTILLADELLEELNKQKDEENNV